MGRTGRTGDKSVTGLLVQAPIRSVRLAGARHGAAPEPGRHIERRTPWSHLDRSQTGAGAAPGQVFTNLAISFVHGKQVLVHHTHTPRLRRSGHLPHPS